MFASVPEMCLDFIDAVRAYFHARARRSVFVNLPREDQQEDMCGKLKKAMYGTRGRAHAGITQRMSSTASRGRFLKLRMEMILQYLAQELDWMGSVK